MLDIFILFRFGFTGYPFYVSIDVKTLLHEKSRFISFRHFSFLPKVVVQETLLIPSNFGVERFHPVVLVLVVSF